MVNKAIIIGRAGNDPEITTTVSGKTVTRFSVATNERWRDKNGEQQERTEWHNVIAWWDVKGVVKGSLVYVEGRLQTSSWESDGQKHYKTEIVAQTIRALERKESATSEGGQSFDEIPF